MSSERSVKDLSGLYKQGLEARVGFEPTNGGFADLSLGPLGYRAKLFSIAKTQASFRGAEFAAKHSTQTRNRLLWVEAAVQAFADSSIPCSSFPGLKRTALPGGIFTSSPVRGLRPIPVLRGFTLKTPKRRNSIRWPRPSALFNDSKTVSTACSAFVRLILLVVTTALTISSLITGASSDSADARGCVVGCQDVVANLHWPSFSIRWF